VLKRPTEAIKPGDDQLVAVTRDPQRIIELGAAGQLAAGLIDEDLLAAGRDEGDLLAVGVLVARRYPPVADPHRRHRTRTVRRVTLTRTPVALHHAAPGMTGRHESVGGVRERIVPGRQALAPDCVLMFLTGLLVSARYQRLGDDAHDRRHARGSQRALTWRATFGLDDVVDHFTLVGDELDLLRNKSGATRLGFAVLLKFLRRSTAEARSADLSGLQSTLSLDSPMR